MTPSTQPPSHPATSFVLPWYRFAELDAFEPWERGAVAEDAAERAATRPGVLVAWALTLGTLAVVAALYQSQLKDWPMGWVVTGAVLAFLPLVLYRRTVVHALVRERAALRRAQGGAADVTRP